MTTRLGSGLSALQYVRDFNFVMGAYNIYTRLIPLRVTCAQRSEQNIKRCDAVTVELAVERSEIINSAEPKRVHLVTLLVSPTQS